MKGVRPAATSSRCFAPVARAQAKRRRLIADSEAFCSATWRTFSNNTGTATRMVGWTARELGQLVEAVAVGDEHVLA